MTDERLAHIKYELARLSVEWLTQNGITVQGGMDSTVLPPPLSYACELYAYIIESQEKNGRQN